MPEESNKRMQQLNLAKQYKSALENLDISDTIVVASSSAIKINGVEKAARELFSGKNFKVTGVQKADSEINEQPINNETEIGARNRLKNAKREIAFSNPELHPTYVSIENGLFQEINPETNKPTGEWEDRVVVIVMLPDGTTTSAVSDGVRFPKDVVEETRLKGGEDEGFKKYTVGFQLAEKGMVKNKQDPHSDLTNGTFTREMQMVSVVQRAFIEAAKNISL
jgi:non-canonical (house-cleaning) NTP pyrophosphatase